jgi:hypothetical protein
MLFRDIPPTGSEFCAAAIATENFSMPAERVLAAKSAFARLRLTFTSSISNQLVRDG